MKKNPTIWKKKTDNQRKTITTSIRTTAKEDKVIVEKAAQAHMTKSQFITAACLQATIHVIPEGKEILAAVHTAKNLLRDFPPTSMANETDALFSQIIVHLYSAISQDQ